MKWRFTYLLLLAMAFAALNVAAQNSITYYVSSDDGEDTNNGLSSTTAFRTLQKAIVEMRNSNVQDVIIRVEGGRQYPFDPNGPFDNIGDSTFRLFRNENNQAGKSLRVLGGYNFITGTRDLVDDKTELKGKTVFDEGYISHIITLGRVDPTADSLIIEGFKISEGDRTGYGDFEFVPGAFSSRASGGGIYITGCNNNKIAIRNCDFVVNEKAVGGAVSVVGSSGINFQNCLFSGNGAFYDASAPVNSGVGGAAYIAFSNVNFQGCVFYVNGSPENRDGSVMYVSNSGGQTVRLVNCTVTGSRGLHPGFGSFYVGSGDLRLINSIVWNNNGAQVIKSSSPTANANIFLSNTIYEWADQYGEDIKWTTAPGFLDETKPYGNDGLWFTADDGLQLAPCVASPALDGGNNASWPSPLTVDVMGNPRTVAGKIDLGAYEEQTSTAYQLWKDADGDGYGPSTVDPIIAHCKLEGYVDKGGDCDDNDKTVYPDAREICGDGKDNNCDGVIDGDTQLILNLEDKDGDGFGDPNSPPLLYCELLPGHSSNNQDCDDNDATIHPFAPEICDGRDNDCNGAVDDGLQTNYYLDADGDGYGKTSDVVASCSPITGRVTKDGDCDDDDNTVYPGAPELCDGKDNDCNNIVDDGVRFNYYLDADGDGYGKTEDVIASCTPITGRVTQSGDCDDNDNTVYPGAPDICDGKDNNCNGGIDDDFSHQNKYFRDSDGDGFGYSQDFVLNCSPVLGRVAIDGDCNDNDANINPNTTWVLDNDNDGYYTGSLVTQCTSPGTGYVIKTIQQAGDCGDNDVAIHPGAAEICGNSIDDNCDGQVDEGCTACSNASGLNTTNITAHSAKLNWTASINPAKWQVEYKDVRADSRWTRIALARTARWVVISSLTSNHTYCWRIRAKCGTTWTNYSTTVSFKTLSSDQLISSTNTQSISSKEVAEEKLSMIKLYPNPTKGQFVVELHISDNINTNAKIELVNLMGQTVSVENASVSNGVLQKNVTISSSVSSGMYMVKVVANNKTYLSKLIYEK